MSSFFDYETEAEELEEQDSGVWLTIGDLMSSLLMIFALLFITVLVKLQSYTEAIDKLPSIILEAIKKEIPDPELVRVNPETGDISIGNKILFDEGSAELKAEGKQFLKQFIPVYSRVIFSDPTFDNQITRVIIEGHTSSKGDDDQNMELSLRRALSVSNYIFSDELKFATKEGFKQKLMASGRGEIEAVQDADQASDRKVVFRFQFRRQDFKELLKKNSIDQNLSEGK